MSFKKLFLICVFVASLSVATVASDKPNKKVITNKVFRRASTPCRGSIDIRNDITKLLGYRNCTTIWGSLSIVLIQKNNKSDIARSSLHQLREITGYLLIALVQNVTDLGILFPNLAVIRGRTLFNDAALIMYEMRDLKEIGLTSLLAIQRGNIIIGACPRLCYINTINWNDLSKGNLIHYSQPMSTNCPTRTSCRSCDKVACWSSLKCQLFEDSKLYKLKMKLRSNTTCHGLCIGECKNATSSGCYTCRGWSWHGTCVAECPKNISYKNEDTMECVTAEECNKLSFVIFEGECIRTCPPGYSKLNPITNLEEELHCFKCPQKCAKECLGTELKYISDSDTFAGCIKIEGDLNIRLETPTNSIVAMEMLEQNLGDVEEITGSLRIYRSFAITSLSFLRSLHTIKGENLFQGKFAFSLHDNFNLQTLWNWKIKKGLKVLKGGLFIHYNTKLCLSEINDMLQNTQYNKSNDFISTLTNGYEQACITVLLESRYMVLSQSSVAIVWQKYIPEKKGAQNDQMLKDGLYNVTDKMTSESDHIHERIVLLDTETRASENVIGYNIYYYKASSKNITKACGQDDCSSDNWEVIYVSSHNLTENDNKYTYNLTNLKPYTQYAFYVRSEVSLMESRINQTVGESDIKYFFTLPGIPSQFVIYKEAATWNSISIAWAPESNENELVRYFFVLVYERPEDLSPFDGTDFCSWERNKVSEKPQKSLRGKRSAYDCCEEQCDKGDNGDCVNSMGNSFNKKLKTMITEGEYRPKNGNDTRRFFHSKSMLTGAVTTVPSFKQNNLKPFRLYTFYLYACNNEAGCSTYSTFSQRTESLLKADDITFNATLAPDSNDIMVNFLSPKYPNGMTLAFNLIHTVFIGNTSNSTKHCIQMPLNNNTFMLTNLQPGLHGIQMRSISLSGNGSYTEWEWIPILPPPADHSLRDSLIAFFILLSLTLLGCFVYWFRYIYQPMQRKIDREHLIADAELMNMDDESDIPNEMRDVDLNSGWDDDEEEQRQKRIQNFRKLLQQS